MTPTDRAVDRIDSGEWAVAAGSDGRTRVDAGREERTRVDAGRGDESEPDDGGGGSMTATDRAIVRIDRGEWAIAAALSIAGLGLAFGSQVLVAAATVPLWYAAAAVLGTRQPTMVRIQRELAVDGDDPRADSRAGEPRDAESGDDEPRDASDVVAADPDDTVTVRTTIRNDGSDAIVDLRVVDGVPEELSVVDGTPRTCVSLEPLETATLEYEVALQRGEYAFGDATVRTRNPTGTVTETWQTAVAGQDTVRCSPPVADVPLGGGTNDYAGEVPTDEGGSGVEFYSVRDYEPGDPVSAIDWRQYAGTRELATVEYRAERATRIVCLVDARSSQFAAATDEDLPAIDLSLDAAERTFEALVAAGHPTGVARITQRDIDTVPPGTDPATRERVAQLLDVTRNWSNRFGNDTRSAADIATELARTLPGEAQVYLFTSFVDDVPVALVERLRTRGYPVRIVSPDVTDGNDVPTRLEALDRKTRLARARATGARVVDWSLERPLGLVLRDAIGEVGRR